jgi:hypothetical protein
MKHFVFRFYPWLAVLVLAVGLCVIVVLHVDGKVGLSGTLIAGVLGFCYFIQQQRLAETQLFKDLFTAFNARYDGLNDRLAQIWAGTAITPEDHYLVVDYLNLCAEKYLFYAHGYILPEVWTSWCRGMCQYLDCPHVAKVIRGELAGNSYYGLSEAIIRKGAS